MEAGDLVWPHLLDWNEMWNASGNLNLFLNIWYNQWSPILSVKINRWSCFWNLAKYTLWLCSCDLNGVRLIFAVHCDRFWVDCHEIYPKLRISHFGCKAATEVCYRKIWLKMWKYVLISTYMPFLCQEQDILQRDKICN